MTSNGTPGPLYPDFRSEDQRRRDGRIAAAQSQALTDSNTDPSRADDLIRRLQAVREQLQSGPDDPPFQIDVIWPDQRDRRHPVLIARGELLLRVSAGPQPEPGPEPHPDHATARTGGEVPADQPADQEADRLLRQLGFQPQIQRVFRRRALPLRTYFTEAKDGAQLVRDRDLVRKETGAEVDLNYVCTTGHTVKDEDYPELTAIDPPYPAAGTGNGPAPRPITVAVIDTGINHQGRTDGWLTAIAETAQNEDPLDVLPADGKLDVSAGHGSFVSGVIQQVAPQATVVVYRAADTDGMATTDAVGTAISQAAADGADIISLSLGTTTVDGQPPAAFTVALQTLQASYPDVLVVASAGNMGSDTPVFPAAMDGVIGVAALNPDLTPVSWSSFGPWVRCSAVGVGVASTFVAGAEPHSDGSSQQFGPNAWAIWSGTSFSAPQVSGRVAQLCQSSTDPVLPLEALDDQLLDGQHTVDGYGALLQILPGS